MHKKYPVVAMSQFFEVSRSGYYAWVDRLGRADRDSARMAAVEAAYQYSRRTYGYRRVTDWLQRRPETYMNHKTTLRLMQKLGIRSVARKRKFQSRAEAIARLHYYPNQLNRNFSATRPNQKWLTDVTYIHTDQGVVYLSVIKDLYDGFIVAYQTSSQNSVALVTTTLRLALQEHPLQASLSLHSDQGSAYCSHDYFLATINANITPSMSRRANCWDNAPMENFFGHLKEEAIRHVRLHTLAQAKEVIDDYIHFYNFERIQLKSKLTPFERRCQFP
jgi:transposase InsO family protein